MQGISQEMLSGRAARQADGMKRAKEEPTDVKLGIGREDEAGRTGQMASGHNLYVQLCGLEYIALHVVL